jgi:DNA uptake protein ComE-like DNA-binding protein
VDPNVAPWWELAALPRIGETTAQRIVEFREQASGEAAPPGKPVFRRAAELTRVSGIGPRTVTRLALHLHTGAGAAPEVDHPAKGNRPIP